MSLLIYSYQNSNQAVATLTYNVVTNYANAHGIYGQFYNGAITFQMTWQDVLNMVISLTNNNSIQVQYITSKWDSQYSTEMYIDAIVNNGNVIINLVGNNQKVLIPQGISPQSLVIIGFVQAGQTVVPLGPVPSQPVPVAPVTPTTPTSTTVEKFSGSSAAKTILIIAVVIFIIWLIIHLIKKHKAKTEVIVL